MIPFDVLFKEYNQKIFNLIYRLTGNYDDAKDLTQDVFLLAYKSYSRFRQEANVYSWLYKIALNHCSNNFKKKRKIVSLDEYMTNNNPGADEELEKKEEEIKVRWAINTLPNKYKEVIILREIENLSYNDISKILSLSKEVVAIRLFRARIKLKKKLEKFRQ